MRNPIDQKDITNIGNMPLSFREDLRKFIDAWYVSEQLKLTDAISDVQLRQAQGAAQVLREISAVLKDPSAFHQSPVPAHRSNGFP
jgi:hypothetical protein